MKFTILQPQAIYELGQRGNQEDTIFPAIGNATTEDRLFIVCDGMGGHQKGEVASSVVCKSLSDFVKAYAPADEVFTDSRFIDGLAAAEADLKAAVQAPGDEQMGTTLVFLYFHRGGCFAAHIGDSRYYHFRPTTGEIVYRSKDHSLVTELYEAGELTKAEQMTADCRNVLTRAMMPAQPHNPEIVHITDIQPGDWFCMFTDGIYEDLTDSELLDIFCDLSLSDAEKCEKLRRLSAGNSDNHSGYMIHIADVEAEPLDSEQPNDEAEARAAHKAFNDDSPERVAEAVTVAEVQAQPHQQAAPATPAFHPEQSSSPHNLPPAPPQPPTPEPPHAEDVTVVEPAPIPQAPPYQQQEQFIRRQSASSRANILWALLVALLTVVAIVVFFVLRDNDTADDFQGPREQTERSMETPKDNQQTEENAEQKKPQVIYKDEYIEDKVPAAPTKPAVQEPVKPEPQTPQPETKPEKPAQAPTVSEPATTPQQPEKPVQELPAPVIKPAEDDAE